MILSKILQTYKKNLTLKWRLVINKKQNYNYLLKKRGF